MVQASRASLRLYRVSSTILRTYVLQSTLYIQLQGFTYNCSVVYACMYYSVRSCWNIEVISILHCG